MTPGRRPDFARAEAAVRARARSVRPDAAADRRVFAALLTEARALGVWPPADPLAGLDAAIRVARVGNGFVPDGPLRRVRPADGR